MPGSSPAGITSYEHVSERPKDADCKPAVRWFESSRALQYGKVAQTVERSVEARKAAGSMPALTTTQIIKLRVEFTHVDWCDKFILGKSAGQPATNQTSTKTSERGKNNKCYI